MKTNPSILPAAIVLFAGIISVPAGDTTKGPHIDPVTGLVAYNTSADAATVSHIDPATGQAATQGGSLLASDEMSNLAFGTDFEVKALILNGRYEEALQRCLAFHNRVKANASLIFLLSDWVELGRRFPKAKAALMGIRDHDVREFSEGRGYFDLFQEVSNINQQYGNTEATYALFKSIREKNPQLARQCAPYIDLLVAEKEGNPQQRFAAIKRSFEGLRNTQKWLAERQQQMAEMTPKPGLTNSGAPPAQSARMKQIAEDRSTRLKQAGEDRFVEQTCQLIANLVATGRRADAEKIRDQALAILNDDRLKSAVTDAGHKLER